MAGFTDAEEATLLDNRYDNTTVYVGLSSTAPNEDGTNVTEPSGGSYDRVAVDGTAGDWNAAVEGAPTVKDNAVAITFPQASADWVGGSDLTHAVIFDAQTDGTLLASAQLSTAKPVLDGDTAEIPVGDLDLKLGDPGDTY